MPLTTQQVLNSIQKPINGEALKRAQLDNDRQRFHTGPATDEKDAGPYVKTLQDRVKGILNNDEKFDKFKKLQQYPVPSTRLIDKAADEYLKAFRAEDRFVDYTLSTDELKADAADYLDSIGFGDWLEKGLFNQSLRASASIWIVDLPAVANLDGFAQPVVQLLEFGKLTDVTVDQRGKLSSVIYKMPDLKTADGSILGQRWAVIDDQSYRIFLQATGQPYEQVVNPHKLGRCPAGIIWHEALDTNNPLRIQSPLHAVLSDLDDLVIGEIFKKDVDLYASFPVLWSYKRRCDYSTIEGNPCRGGVVTTYERDEQGLYSTNDAGKRIEKEVACPRCAAAKPIGPGSQLLVPQPKDKDDANLSQPAGFINAERTLLDYNAEKLEALKQDILESLTGDSNNVDQTKDAVNQDQVQARFEARKGILSYWASHLEQTQYDVMWVLLSLRYGPSFQGLVVSYGTEFHLLSPAQAVTDYADARKAGLPMYQLAARRARLDKLLAGQSPEQIERMALMAELEPYPDLLLTQVPVGSDAWELKAGFGQYIARFERDNISLVLFGSALSDGEKLSAITEILYSYVNENRGRTKVPEPTTGERPGNSKPSA